MITKEDVLLIHDEILKLHGGLMKFIQRRI